MVLVVCGAFEYDGGRFVLVDAGERWNSLYVISLSRTSISVRKFILYTLFWIEVHFY